MYKLPNKERLEFIQYLKNVVVQSSVGANLITMATILENLEEIKEEAVMTPIKDSKIK